MALTMRLMLDWYEYFDILKDYDYNKERFTSAQTFGTWATYKNVLNVFECAFEITSTQGACRCEYTDSQSLFEECSFINCISTSDVGGLYYLGKQLVIDRNCFYNCQNEENGQAIFSNTGAKGNQKLENSIYISSIVGCGNSEKRGVTFLMQSGRINISNVNCTGNKGQSNTCCQLWSDISDSYIKYSTFYGNSQSTDTSLTLQTDQSTMAYVISSNFINNSVGEDPINAQFKTTKVSRIIKCSFIKNGELLFGSRSGTMIVEKCFIDRKEISTSGNVNIVSRAGNVFFFDYSHFSNGSCEANDLIVNDIIFNVDEPECSANLNCEHYGNNFANLIFLSGFRLTF